MGVFGLVDAVAEKDPLTREVIGGAIEVHRALGPGLLEAIYEQCLGVELAARGLDVRRQVGAPVTFRELVLDNAYRADLIVNDRVVIEVKAVESVQPVHVAQLMTYMKLLDKPVGLLLNFHVALMKDGIYRKVI